MLKKRILSFLGAAALTAALTFAVVSLSPSNGFTSGSMQEGMSYEVCGVSPDAIVASLDGNGASADLITYWIGYNATYLNSYMQYYGGGALDWDYVMSDGTAMPDYIKQDVLATVKQELLIENLAKKYGVTSSARRSSPKSRASSSSTAARKPSRKSLQSSAFAARPTSASPPPITSIRISTSST